MKSLQERNWFFSQEREKFECTVPSPHYDVYRLKTTRQVICDINIDEGICEEPIIIGVVTDTHFNFCNMEDRADEELAYTEVCRQWLKDSKSVVPAVKALAACDFLDATVVCGDILDYLSKGAAELTRTHIIKKYPEAMLALGGHDITKQMQTGRPDMLPLEERVAEVAKFWPHDIHYYSRTVKDKVLAVILDNSCSRYLDCQVEKLRSDIETARREGKIIVIFQHEPIAPKNPEYTEVKAVIANGGAGSSYNFAGAHMIGLREDTDEATAAVYDLIVSNADVIKAVIAGHCHSQYYTEIKASYENNGDTVKTVIPQYVISGNPYYEAGFVARIIIK